MARQFSTGTKFGSEKGKVQKPARIPPQTPPAGGTEAEAGQFSSKGGQAFPRKIVFPADLSAVALAEAESKLVFRVLLKKSSNINQKTPPIFTFCEIARQRAVGITAYFLSTVKSMAERTSQLFPRNFLILFSK